MTLLNEQRNLEVGLTFDELQSSLAKLPSDKRVGSPNTLADVLKTLVRKGLVERNIETRRYRVPEGMPKALTDELGRRDLTSRISESKEFSALYDRQIERGIMHGFVVRSTSGRGVNALTWEAPHAFDSLLGHVTRGILDLAKSNGLFDGDYFEGKRDPQEIQNEVLEKIWTELSLRANQMILTYEIDTEMLLNFLKSPTGKKFLAKACREYPRLGVFHGTLDMRWYQDNPAMHGIRTVVYIKRQVKPQQTEQPN
jgi:DNA-binding HxlR family transcriptional regulator